MGADDSSCWSTYCSQRIACAYGYRLVWVWLSCHDGRSSDAGARLIEQSTAYWDFLQ